MNPEQNPDCDAERDMLFTTDEAIKLYTDRITDPTFFPQERKAVERYFTKTDASVLDVGCGVGRVAHLLHERGFNVTGIDVSERMVEKAHSLFPNIEFHTADIRHTPFNSATFDYVIFSFYGLDYIHPKRERMKALKEIRRVLKPAGIAVLSSHNNWHPLVPLSVSDLGRAVKDVADLYLRKKNCERLFSRYKFETVPLGEVEIYLSNPTHQWRQLRKCGFTSLDIVGERDGVLRFFERNPHYIAKK